MDSMGEAAFRAMYGSPDSGKNLGSEERPGRLSAGLVFLYGHAESDERIVINPEGSEPYTSYGKPVDSGFARRAAEEVLVESKLLAWMVERRLAVPEDDVEFLVSMHREFSLEEHHWLGVGLTGACADEEGEVSSKAPVPRDGWPSDQSCAAQAVRNEEPSPLDTYPLCIWQWMRGRFPTLRQDDTKLLLDLYKGMTRYEHRMLAPGYQ